MLQTLEFAAEFAPSLPYRTDAESASIGLAEDASRFGLQGLTRHSLSILKPDCITPLGMRLALTGTPDQIRDEQFVARQLAAQPTWSDEYRIVHLIEKSLWIEGHSDLVMTLLKNPSQIPDNPPPSIMRALSRAYQEHPEATIWYGVPLFSDEKNADGLPIPMTAAQVAAESQQRLQTAIDFALRWRWAIRTGRAAANVPNQLWSGLRRAAQIPGNMTREFLRAYRRALADSRARTKAFVQAELEKCRLGRSQTVVPDHTTSLGRFAYAVTSSAAMIQSTIGNALPDNPDHYIFGSAAVGAFAQTAAAITSIAWVPTAATVIACDPFLFLELPEEPGKLRYIGHWYWQDRGFGRRKKLHVHTHD